MSKLNNANECEYIEDCFLSYHALEIVFNCICESIFCLTTSSLSAHSLTASYSSRAAVFHRTTFSHSAAVLFSAVSFVVTLILESNFFYLASHCFQSSFAHAAVPFYFSSYLQLLGFFFIHSNAVKSCLQAYCTFFLPSKYYVSFQKRKAVFRFDFAITTIIFNLNNSNQFLLQTIYQGQFFRCRA